MDEAVTLPFGTFSGEKLIGLAALDTFQHAWDLAETTGQDTDLNAELAEPRWTWQLHTWLTSSEARNPPPTDRSNPPRPEHRPQIDWQPFSDAPWRWWAIRRSSHPRGNGKPSLERTEGVATSCYAP